MIVTLHMCGPEGEVLRRQLAEALNMLKDDNRYVINAMLNSGEHVPDTVIDADLDYEPSQHMKAVHGEPTQEFFGMKRMFEMGTFSCGDAAAYEAAVQEEKYGVPTEVIVTPTTGDSDYHALYVTPEDVVDPTENWFRYWAAQIGLEQKPLVTPKRSSKSSAADLNASCEIVNGRVACHSDAGDGCCVDVDRGVLTCGNANLSGQRVEIDEVFTSPYTDQRWARTKDGMFVPVCGGTP